MASETEKKINKHKRKYDFRVLMFAYINIFTNHTMVISTLQIKQAFSQRFNRRTHSKLHTDINNK